MTTPRALLLMLLTTTLALPTSALTDEEKNKLAMRVAGAFVVVAAGAGIGAIVGGIHTPPSCCDAKWACDGNWPPGEITVQPCKGVVDCKSRYSEYATGCAQEIVTVVRYGGIGAALGAGVVACFREICERPKVLGT